MDLFVLPSLFGEGLPMVVLEAMSAGLPVVASAVSGVPEAVRDGVEGLLVEPGNSAALAAAVGRFVSREVSWNKLGSGALLRHAECFSDLRMAADVARVYDSVLFAK
jgi:glycosyltransferase involved in cell wall biosynthesis